MPRLSKWEKFLTRNGRAIDSEYERFRLYRGITQDSIPRWIRQFQPEHWNLALRVIQRTFFVSTAGLFSAYQSIHRQLLRVVNDDLSHVYFAPMGLDASSSEGMRYNYKVANVRQSPELTTQCVPRTGLSSILGLLRIEQPAVNPVVVFIDDVCGSGDQALEAWFGKTEEDERGVERRVAGLQEMIPPDATVFFAFAVTFESARRRIAEATEDRIRVLSWMTLRDEERVFSDTSRGLSPEDREILFDYCLSTESEEFTFGWGDVGGTVIFEHNCPDINIPILWWERERSWDCLFRRY